MDTVIYDHKIKNNEICKKCFSLNQYKLVQTGNTGDFVSKKCPVCNTLHTSEGEIYIPKIKGKDILINKCPICGSEKITRSVFHGGFIWCSGCSAWVPI